MQGILMLKFQLRDLRSSSESSRYPVKLSLVDSLESLVGGDYSGIRSTLDSDGNVYLLDSDLDDIERRLDFHAVYRQGGVYGTSIELKKD